jgi:hypothetical protein
MLFSEKSVSTVEQRAFHKLLSTVIVSRSKQNRDNCKYVLNVCLKKIDFFYIPILNVSSYVL